jgi:uncharacterized protein (DUF58 family)
MDFRSNSNGLRTFLEHWWFLIIVAIAVLASQIATFFMQLTGTPFIWCYGLGLAVALAGVLVIFYAKFPLYRQRRSLTFGSRALPESRRSFYRWGCRCVLFAAALLLCLFLSRP